MCACAQQLAGTAVCLCVVVLLPLSRVFVSVRVRVGCRTSLSVRVLCAECAERAEQYDTLSVCIIPATSLPAAAASAARVCI